MGIILDWWCAANDDFHFIIMIIMNMKYAACISIREFINLLVFWAPTIVNLTVKLNIHKMFLSFCITINNIDIYVWSVIFNSSFAQLCFLSSSSSSLLPSWMTVAELVNALLHYAYYPRHRHPIMLPFLIKKILFISIILSYSSSPRRTSPLFIVIIVSASSFSS